MTLRRRRARPLFGIVAVVQVILLLTSVMVIPARVIAQDPSATPEATAEAAPVSPDQVDTADAAQPAGNGKEAPDRKVQRQRSDAPDPEAEAEPEPAWVLRIHPRVVTLDSGASRRVRAFRCDEGAGGFGRDRKPATEDDSCSPVKVTWSEKETDLLALSRETGRRVRVTAGASTGDSLLVAKRDGEKAEAAVRVKASKASSAEVAATGDSERAEVDPAASHEPDSEAVPTEAAAEPRPAEPGSRPEEERERSGPDQPDQPEAQPKAEPQPEPTVEPAAAAEPQPDAAPTIESEPRSDREPEPTVDREPTAPAEPEPTVEPEPTAAAEPEPIVEPNAEPEPTAAAEPELSVEPSVEPQPTAASTLEPAPSAAVEPTPESEPAATAEPSAEHELAAELSPAPSVEPEPSGAADPCPVPEPASSAAPGTEASLVPDASAGATTCVGPIESPSPGPSAETTPESPGESAPPAELNRATVIAAADIDGNGLFDDLVTIESPPGTILQNVRAVPVPSDPAPPDGVAFPAGLFDYEVVVAEPGDPATVIFQLPDGAVGDGSETEFWVLQNGRWSDLTARSEADAVTDEVTVSLVDGGPGDEDLVADGVIDDPGGPGQPEEDWSFTINLIAPSDPGADFTFFMEECTEIDSATPCTPQDPRLWVDSDAAPDAPTVVDPTPVVLSDGESFTFNGLEPDRHYRVIGVGTASPPAAGTGVLPAGWAVTGFQCESIGATIVDTGFNSVAGWLTTTDAEGITSPGTAVCNVTADRLLDVRSGSTIIANKYGDRASNGTNQPLAGATMGLWDDDGDGEFEPGDDDGDPIDDCVTNAAGSCSFTLLAAGDYWVQELSTANTEFAAITTWAPGAYNVANPPLPYAAYRYGDPASDGFGENNGYPLRVNGTPSHVVSTDSFANRRVNPSISDFQCDALMRIVVVLDRSGSIQENGPGGYEAAINSFVQDLSGTNTQMGVVSFAADARIDEGYLDIDDDQAAILDAIEDVYNDLGGGTNWDAGLRLVDTFSPNPDLVLMVTDGNPTLNERSSTSSGEVNWHDFTEAVTSSNRLKSGGGAAPPSRVIAVAAGSAGSISVEGLIGISGPLTNQPNALDDDYFLGTVEELAEALRELALARCGSSVRVKKEIETSPGVWGPGAGWTFDIDVSGDPGVTPVPPTQTVLAGGVAEIVFAWAGPGQRTVTLTEENVDPAPDYFDPQIVCWPGPAYEGEGAPLTPTSVTARSVTFTIPSDADRSCRFRNSPQPIELIIEKTVINDDGGTATVDDFGIAIDPTQTLTFSTITGTPPTLTYTADTLLVPAGEYTLSELAVAGYTPTDWTCTNDDTGAFDGTTVTLETGDPTVTCSITNDDEPIELIIEKTVINDDGGTATVDDFGIAIDPTQTLTFSTITGTPPTLTYTADTLLVPAGEYTLSELAVAGYTPTDWTCTNDDTGAFDGTTVTLETGDPTVTCSITNDDEPIELIIVKTVINDDGGTATVDDFGIAIDPTQTLTFSTITGTPPTLTYTADTLLVPAGEYTLSELAVAGYTPTDWTCTNDDTGAFDGTTVTLETGDPTVTCSITNDDEPIELIIEKTVINDDGGTATVDDFGIAIDPTQTLTFSTITGTPPTLTYTADTLLVPAGEYTLSELAVAGYTPTDWTCTNDDTGAFDGTTVTLETGDPTVTCSITNDDEPIELIIVKTVINDDGGTATVDDFGIAIDPTQTLTFSTITGTPPTLTYTADTLLVPAGEYTLSELAVAGYTPTDWTCTNDDTGAFDGTTVTLETGDPTVTCSITNDDEPIELIIVKTVINDDGGTATVDDFGIAIDPTQTLTFSTITGTPPTLTYTADTLLVPAGEYTLSELAVAGYTPTDWTCTNDDTGAFDGTTVTLETGDPTVTCSITNDDEPIELIIVKTVINDDGGTATVDDFGIAIDPTQTLTFSTITGTPPTLTYTADTLLVPAGEYTLSELAVAGYTPTDWTCTNDDTGAFDGTTVTLETGDPTVTCSITNDDEPIELIIVKTVINDDGGTATVDDFGIATTAGALTFSAAVEDPTDTFTYTAETLGVAAGTYELAELELPGYAPSDWTCSNGDGGPFDTGTVTLASGDDPVTCSITNNDFAIEVLKVADDHLIPPEGQDVTFTFTVTNPSDIPVEIVSLEDDVFGTLSGDADCQVGTILPPGGSCEFEETFFVESDVVPNGDPDQVFPPHVNTFSSCAAAPAVVPASATVPAAIAGPGEDCDDDPETIRFTGGGIAGCCQPPTDSVVPMSDTSTPSTDLRFAWLALMAMAAIAIVAAGATIGRLRRDERAVPRRGS